MTVKSCVLCLPYLEKLCKAKNDSERRKILKKCPKQIYSIICEIIKNVLNGNVRLSNYFHKKLHPYKNVLRKLARKGNLKLRKKIINQKGGFLNALLVPVISILAKIAADKLLT